MPALASGRQQFWLVTALALAAVGGLLVLNVLLLRYLARNWETATSTRETLSSLSRREEETARAHRILAGLSRERELVESGFADPADPLPLIEQIEDLGRRDGVELEVKLAPGERPGRAESYFLSATGPFARVMTFLESLESFPLLVRLGDTDLVAARRSEGKTAKEPSLSLTTTLTIFAP